MALSLGLGIGLTRAKGGGAELTPLSMRRVSGLTDLTLPSPYSGIGPEMVHPSVVYIPEGWHGYKYWMAVTPYPSADNDYENPCILASNDSIAWEVPPGVVNPIVPPPADVAGGGFNSDPHLVRSPDGNKLYLLYRYFTAGAEPRERLRLLETSDGITWSSPQTIFSSNATVQRLVSPSIWWDGSQWVIVATDIVPAGRPFRRLANGGADPYSGWPSTTTDVVCPHPSGGDWWHAFLTRLPNGKIMGLMQDGSSGGGSLYLTDSADNGQTFTAEPFDLAGGYYRSCFVPTSYEGNGAGILFAGRINPSFKIQRGLLQFDRQKSLAEVQAFIADTIAAAAPSTWSDDFARADSATSLGNAKSGQSYTVDTGTLGIASGRAYNSVTTNSRGLINLGAGAQNLRLVAQVASAGAQVWLIFRAIDTNNYWRLGFNGGNLTLQKIVGGAVTVNQVVQNGVGSVGALLEVIADATSIRILSNSAFLFEYAETPSTSATRVGLQAAGATPSYVEQVAAKIAA